MAIFQKNITSKMDENGLKYMSRTNLHFDIGPGWLVHEKFFTAAKLRFLAGQASLLDEASTGTQNWSVRAMSTSIQSISVISQTYTDTDIHRQRIKKMGPCGYFKNRVPEPTLGHPKPPKHRKMASGGPKLASMHLMWSN